MKELSIEEKAMAYDKAFKEAESIHRFSSNIAEIKRMEQIFPELLQKNNLNHRLLCLKSKVKKNI